MGCPISEWIVARKLPRAQVAGNDQHALAPIARGKIMLQPLVAQKPLRLFRRVARHLAEFRQQPAQIAIERAQNLLALGNRLLRKCELEIGEPDLAQPAQQPVGCRAYARAQRARPATRQ